MHGGSAAQVRAAREARIVAAEAAQQAGTSTRSAGEVLLAAMHDADAILQRLKVNITSGRVEAADLTALGDWIDRATRVAKTVADAKIDERRTVLAEHQGQMLVQVIRAVLESMLSEVTQALRRSEVDEYAVEALHAGWPAWVGHIVPRELRAVADLEREATR